MKKYNSEFRSMIGELYKIGRAVKDLSREYGVSEVTISKWIKQISAIASIDDSEITLEEIKCMKQEIFSTFNMANQIMPCKEGYSPTKKPLVLL